MSFKNKSQDFLKLTNHQVEVPSELETEINDPKTPVVINRNLEAIKRLDRMATWSERVHLISALLVGAVALIPIYKLLLSDGINIKPEMILLAAIAVAAYIGVVALPILAGRSRRRLLVDGPVFELKRNELVIDSVIHIPWEEIESVNRRYGVVRIVPRDLANTVRKMTGKSFLIGPMTAKLAGTFVKAIDIPSSVLPYRADEVIRLINTRRNKILGIK